MKKIYVDIDETICFYADERDYVRAKPIVDNIDAINKLYESGNEITYWTARGTTTGICWRKETERQLNQWGAKYHNLHLGKPDYDLFICDKAINASRFFEDV